MNLTDMGLTQVPEQGLIHLSSRRVKNAVNPRQIRITSEIREVVKNPCYYLKSWDPQGSCLFDSGPRHQICTGFIGLFVHFPKSRLTKILFGGVRRADLGLTRNDHKFDTLSVA